MDKVGEVTYDSIVLYYSEEDRPNYFNLDNVQANIKGLGYLNLAGFRWSSVKLDHSCNLVSEADLKKAIIWCLKQCRGNRNE